MTQISSLYSFWVRKEVAILSLHLQRFIKTTPRELSRSTILPTGRPMAVSFGHQYPYLTEGVTYMTL
jgi:hypothetical protein